DGRGSVSREPPAPGILSASSVSPADTSRIPRSDLLGVVSGDGGALSHAAIVSRALGIPAVVGVGPQIELLTPGRWVVLDGARGTVDLLDGAPEGARLARRATRRTADARRAATADGVPVRL